MEVHSGPGPSPYAVQELIAFASDRSLVERLNAFEGSRAWRGPNVEALVDAIEEAIKQSPTPFIDLIPAFVDAKPPYQVALLNGLKKVIQARALPDGSSSEAPWARIVSLCESLSEKPQFWEIAEAPSDGLLPYRNWLPGLVAELLKVSAKSRRPSHTSSGSVA